MSSNIFWYYQCLKLLCYLCFRIIWWTEITAFIWNRNNFNMMSLQSLLINFWNPCLIIVNRSIQLFTKKILTPNFWMACNFVIHINFQLFKYSFDWNKCYWSHSEEETRKDCRENSLHYTLTVIRPIKTDDAGVVNGRTEGESAITMPGDFNWSVACSHWQIRHLQ